MRRITLLPALGLGLVFLARFGQAQVSPSPNPNTPGQPSGLTNLIQSGRNDINAAYAVNPEAGPWMICVASYQGESSPELAYLLCTYLRQKHFQAYVYNRGNADREKLQKELDERQKMLPGVPRRRILAHPQEEQFAVLLGGFREMDEANAQIKKVRNWDMPDIKLQSGKPAFDTYDHYEQVPGKKTYELKRYAVNPFHSAFVVPNPTLPQPKRAAAKADPFLKQINAGEPRSLFKCPKPWTLAVQEFHGASTIQSTAASNSFMSKIGLGDHAGKSLDQSARMAQQVCDMFKKLGFKSYVLHTRCNSFVTVGEFKSRDDPDLQRTQEQLKKMSFRNGNTGQTAFNLFATPLPMEVPR